MAWGSAVLGQPAGTGLPQAVQGILEVGTGVVGLSNSERTLRRQVGRATAVRAEGTRWGAPMAFGPSHPICRPSGGRGPRPNALARDYVITVTGASKRDQQDTEDYYNDHVACGAPPSRVMRFGPFC